MNVRPIFLPVFAMTVLTAFYSYAETPAWQSTLRAALTNRSVGSIPLGNIGRTYYTEPGDVGQILERQPTNELLHFLAQLRSEPHPWGSSPVNTWMTIVRKGLRGHPSTVTNSLVAPDGKVSLKVETVYSYTDFYWPPIRLDPFGFFKKIAYGSEDERRIAMKTLATALNTPSEKLDFEQADIASYPVCMVDFSINTNCEHYAETAQLWLRTIDTLIAELPGEGGGQARVILDQLTTLPAPRNYEPVLPPWYGEKKKFVDQINQSLTNQSRSAVSYLAQADTISGLDWYVANAEVIAIVQAQSAPSATAPTGKQRLLVRGILKGVETAQEYLVPEGALRPDQPGVLLVQYVPPNHYEPGVQTKREASPSLLVWPMDSADSIDIGKIPAHTGDGFMAASGNIISLESLEKEIAASSLEQVGLNAQVLDALLFPEKFKTLAAQNPSRAAFVRFVIAIRDLNNDRPAIARLSESTNDAVRSAAETKLRTLIPESAGITPHKSRSWPPVPADFKTPLEAFPEPLLQSLQNTNSESFSEAFAVWLGSGVMRDREIHFAETLDRKIINGSDLGGAVGNQSYLPPAPRFRPDVIFNSNIPVEDRMKAVALLAELYQYDRFATERADAVKWLDSESVDEETLRRAAFWELRDGNINTPGRVAVTALAKRSGPQTQHFLLELCFHQHMDDALLNAMRTEVKAGREFFIDDLIGYIKTNHDDKAQWIGRVLAQEHRKEIVPIITAWLKADDASVRKAAAFNLSWLPDANGVPALTNAIRSEIDPSARAQMLMALAQNPDARGLDTLLSSTDEPLELYVRGEIVRGVARIRDPRALPVLANLAFEWQWLTGDKNPNDDTRFDHEWGFVSEIANAFGYISHLYDAHKPGDFQTGSAVNRDQVRRNIAAITEWYKHQPKLKNP